MKFEEAFNGFWSNHKIGTADPPAFMTSSGEDAGAAILNDEVETDNPLLKLMLEAMKPGLSGEFSSKT